MYNCVMSFLTENTDIKQPIYSDERYTQYSMHNVYNMHLLYTLYN